MNDLTLIWKNVWRKWFRTTLLVFSILIAFLIYGILGGFNNSLKASFDQTQANRLVVTNKINFTQDLPFSYVDRVRRVKGVNDVTWQNWFGGYYQDPRNAQFAMFAVDPESYLRIYSDVIVLPEAQKQAFLQERTGVLIGRAFADRFNVKVGQRIPFFSNIYTNRTTGAQSWDFVVSGIYDGKDKSTPTSTNYFHFDYFNETVTFGQDAVGLVTAVTASPDLNDQVAKAIDGQFANSSDETYTQDEKAFARSFLAQAGDIGFIVNLVVSAAFGSILFIVGTTMVLAIRERTKEIGVMKTLGFSSPRILRLVLGESLAIALIGALVGLGLATFALGAVGKASGGFIGDIGVTPLTWAWGLGFALLLGLATGLIPALNAFSLKIVDALNRR